MGPDYLIQEMRVTNTGDDDLSFTGALHTYFRVKNVDKARCGQLQTPVPSAQSHVVSCES